MSGNRDTNRYVARVVLFMGAPGSGKGTQSAWLSGTLGIPCLSTGEVLRSEARRNTPSGVRLRRTLASGALVDDEQVCEVVGARLRSHTPDPGMILDGFPRTVTQAAFLDSLLADLGLPRPRVIYLHVSEAGLLRRLGARRHCAVCGTVYNLHSRPSARGPRCEIDGGLLTERDDDREEIIIHRLREFETSSAPLLDYYRNADLHCLDGDRDPEAVAGDLLERVTREELCVAA